MLVLTVLGAMAMLLAGSRSLSDQVRANVGFIVKMEPGCAAQQLDALKQRLAAAPYVDRYAYADPAAIMAEESEAMGEDLAGLVDANPYGAEFDIKVRPAWAVGDSIVALARSLEMAAGVEQVVTQTAVVDSVNSVMRRVGWTLAAVAAALLIISFVLISNAVSLAVYSRRFVIYTMKLVGATGGYIRRPFLAAGALTGLVAAAAAIAMLAALRGYAGSLDPAAAALVPWPAMAVIAAGLAVTGPAICTAAALVSTNRYLRIGYDDLYMK